MFWQILGPLFDLFRNQRQGLLIVLATVIPIHEKNLSLLFFFNNYLPSSTYMNLSNLCEISPSCTFRLYLIIVATISSPHFSIMWSNLNQGLPYKFLLICEYTKHVNKHSNNVESFPTSNNFWTNNKGNKNYNQNFLLK